MIKKIVVLLFVAFAASSVGYSAAIVGKDGKCLDLNAGNTANGTHIQMWSCQGGNSNQNWKVVDAQIKHTPSGKCVDVSGNNSANGTKIILWSCHGGNNQKWKVEGGKIKGLAGKCLDVPGGNTANGTQMQLWSCGGGNPNQRWEIR